MQEPNNNTNDSHKHIWQIDRFCHCSLVGLGFSIAEQRKLMRHQDIKAMSDYEVHAWLLSFCPNPNKLSRRLETLLNVKYAKDIRLIDKLSQAEAVAHWQACLSSGELAGAYWAILRRWDTTAELQGRLFGDVHMLSHQHATIRRNARLEIDNLKQDCRRLNERLQREKDLRLALQNEITELNAKLISPKPTVLAPTGPAPDLDQGAALRLKLERQQQLIDSLRPYRKQNEELIRKLAETEARNLELHLQQAQLAAAPAEHACTPDCPAYATCARRVLLVGGITKIAAHYREVVARSGCEFEHHDGYLRDGEKVLEGKISRCDLVICPVDVNSHNACLCVKKICKRLNKPYHMLPSSSLSAVARSLSS